jgi:hypothetical protein
MERHLAERLSTDRKRAADELLESVKQEGTGDLTVPDSYALSDEYAITMSFKLARSEIGNWPSMRIAISRSSADRWITTRRLRWGSPRDLTFPISRRP